MQTSLYEGALCCRLSYMGSFYLFHAFTSYSNNLDLTTTTGKKPVEHETNVPSVSHVVIYKLTSTLEHESTFSVCDVLEKHFKAS